MSARTRHRPEVAPPPLPPGLEVYRPLELMGSAILVVDDEQAMQFQLKLDLRDLGYQPRVAGSAAEAKATLTHERVAAVLLDLVLDEGEDAGFELLTWIRQHHPGLPVVVLSAAQVSSAAIRRAYELGGSSYFVKGNVPLAHIYSDLAARVMDGASGRMGVYRFGPLIFDSNKRTMRLDDKEVRLTPQQTSLVVFLAHGSKPATAADLIEAGLFTPDAARSTVHSSLLTLRRKVDELQPGMGKRFLLSTARGYTLRPIE